MLHQLYQAGRRCQSGGSKFWPSIRHLKRDQRGSILITTALVTPVLAMGIGMGVEISHWTVVRLELQRTADVAALAGATEYAIATNAINAAHAAANVAELNGAKGATTRTWNASEKLLNDNQVTAQVTAGVRQRQDTALKVTVSQTIPLMLTRTMSLSPSITISAVGWAELTITPQPCLVALSTGGSGVSAQGNPSVTMEGCSVRSNASITTGGSASMSASAFYANGSITEKGISGPRYPNKGTIPDPYETHAPTQAAFKKLASGSGSPLRDKPKDVTKLDSTISNTFSYWDIKGEVTLKPGIYYVNGDILLGSQARLSGAGVTIVTSGIFKMLGGSSVTLSAALKRDATAGAIPGVVFAGNSTSDSSFHGNTSPSLTGVVYYPRGKLEFGGNAQGGSNGCLEVIAASVELKGNSGLASKCSDYGALPFSSGGAAVVALVQ